MKGEVTEKEEQRNIKKQLTGILAIVIVGVFLTSGSYAYYNAPLTSSGALFPACTNGIDFQMASDTVNYASNPSPLITVSNLLPGQETGVYHIYYWNLPDSLTVTVLLNTAYTCWYAGQGVSADNFARHLWITQASLDGNPGVEPWWSQQIAEIAYGSWISAINDGAIVYYNNHYIPTLYGMHLITVHFSATYMGADLPWVPGRIHTTGLNFMLDPSVGNEYINSGIFVTLTASVTQFSPNINCPPYKPCNPCPCNGATRININARLSWTGGDPDAGDIVTYDVYFGTTNSPTIKVSSNQTAATFNPGTLVGNTHYYWKIVAWDNHGAYTAGSVWSFTTNPSNHPPKAPCNPYPCNGATRININARLSWTGGDPDAGDIVTYDVYFGTTNSPTKVSSNQSAATFNPGILVGNTHYYWKIVAWDNHGAHTAGSVWSFTT
jgi:hypothetical protein